MIKVGLSYETWRNVNADEIHEWIKRVSPSDYENNALENAGSRVAYVFETEEIATLFVLRWL